MVGYWRAYPLVPLTDRSVCIRKAWKCFGCFLAVFEFPALFHCTKQVLDMNMKFIHSLHVNFQYQCLRPRQQLCFSSWSLLIVTNFSVSCSFDWCDGCAALFWVCRIRTGLMRMVKHASHWSSDLAVNHGSIRYFEDMVRLFSFSCCDFLRLPCTPVRNSSEQDTVREGTSFNSRARFVRCTCAVAPKPSIKLWVPYHHKGTLWGFWSPMH